MTKNLPIIDIGPLRSGSPKQTALAIDSACRDMGFFYISNHGVDIELQTQLETVSRIFFSRPEQEKKEIAMSKGGRAWRGYFPVGGELTSGKPDLKEGLYFGEELSQNHPKVLSKTPLHGSNLFPTSPVAMREVVLKYMQSMLDVGHTLMRGIALALNLDPQYFHDHFTRDPLILFRIFNYPPPREPNEQNVWGVGEHTDYGVLTILKQDNNGGLEVKSRKGWISAPPIPNTFVCNIGDMLDRMTGGLYRSTPHRVRNVSGRERLSYPFFFDPNFDARVQKLPLPQAQNIIDDSSERWDKASVHDFSGTYGEYLLRKVGKVFPDLSQSVL